MHFPDLNPHFNFFIGLDQTGAVFHGGERAKPLPLAWVETRVDTRSSSVRPKLTALTRDGKKLRLDSFSPSALAAILTREMDRDCAHHILRSSQTAILADAVFGLPAETWPRNKPPGAATLRELFAMAAEDTRERQGYGLKAAARFFDEILAQANRESQIKRSNSSATNAPPPAFPVRAVELVANANSVFRTHPFQKNIQCGTYRFWRDLGLYGSEWIHLRYFENARDFRMDRPILFEAYPSLMWREVLKLRTRNRTQVREALKAFSDVDISEETVALIEQDADHADACLLALGGYWLARHGRLIAESENRDPKLAREGWIAGLPRP